VFSFVSILFKNATEQQNVKKEAQQRADRADAYKARIYKNKLNARLMEQMSFS